MIPITDTLDGRINITPGNNTAVHIGISKD